ncbi:hypothetical protein PybrP1_009239 [[Pythium] brassicae (nom. inval.)]|nr:hypothetical protein PybrP1_009239 [[Pythium] brassicae (nom. inval.)]
MDTEKAEESAAPPPPEEKAIGSAGVDSDSDSKVPATLANASNASADTGAEVASSATKRVGRRGLTTRKRLGLKIDAELTAERADSCEETREGQPTQSRERGGDSGASDAKAVPWWVLEYRCPPPGHLGAHHVPVAAKADAATVKPSTEPATGPEPEKLSTPQSQHNDTPAAAQVPIRKLMSAGAESVSARQRTQQQLDVPDYSPSQKRKMDTSALSPATEPKRLREPPTASVQRVTPSHLVRPLTKIDIHCQRTPSSTSSSNASGATASASASAPSGSPSA